MAALLSSDEDSPVRATSGVRRTAQPRLRRADLDRALSGKPPSPPPKPARRPGAALSLEQLQERAKAIDRRAQALNRAQAQPSKEELPPPPPPATRSAEVMVEDGHKLDVDLGLSEHVAQFTRLARSSEVGDEATIAHALEHAVRSLSEVEAQQNSALQLGVDFLKSAFQQRLQALEAEFVRRAEELSDELAGEVAERKHACTAAVAAHAEECEARLLQATRVGGAEERRGERRSGFAPPQASTLVFPRELEEEDALSSVSADVDAILGRARPVPPIVVAAAARGARLAPRSIGPDPAPARSGVWSDSD